MVDLQQLRKTIGDTPGNGTAAIVTRDWLEEVERELTELEQRRAQDKAGT
jgi:hypothetical protein